MLAVGTLQMATKYLVPRLREQAIHFLTQAWPYTLQDLDIMVDKALKRPSVAGLSYPFLHPVHLLNLGLSHDVRLLIPSALYFLSCYPLADILREDHPKLRIEHAARPSSTFSKAWLEQYTLMYQYRIETIFKFTYEFLPSQIQIMGCTSPSSCGRVFARMVFKFQRSFNTRASPLYLAVQALREADARPLAICDPCCETFKTNVDNFRQRFWQSLPGLAGLPDWSVLLASDLPSAIPKPDGRALS